MMDAQALLETIEKHLTSGFVWTQETGMSEHPAQVALANLRAYIATQQTLLEQAQAVASQQQATLEKVEKERQAYREFYQVMIDADSQNEHLDYLKDEMFGHENDSDYQQRVTQYADFYVLLETLRDMNKDAAP